MVATAPFAETGATTTTSLPLSKTPSPPLRTSWNELGRTVPSSTGSSKFTVMVAGTAAIGAASVGEMLTTAIGSLSTVTFTGADVVSFAHASLARAVRLTAPSFAVVVSQDTSYGGLAALPMSAASAKKSTCVTPTSSLASAETVTVPDTGPATGAVSATVGGWLSPLQVLSTVTCTDGELPWLPAASEARATSVWLPSPESAVFPRIWYGAVASLPTTLPSTSRSTFATPTLSAAVMETGTLPLTVAPPAGEVMLAVGAVASLTTLMLTPAEVVTFPAASC